ncbi:Non-hemolytic phospholipase C [Lachnellula subtilissima]|uniref:Non-hemolytic phospholipase C n=1 Tax=Lachnellula subtilissima TaxID=602034 RepID=A0A8H8RRT1_9HELO|nr:Non-hemolytic phospholipase C [Lachnellula subtilissima]
MKAAFIFIHAAIASAGSLKDIKHVVLFMQENRAFDHYFGTMAGVRGFSDPNVQVNADGKNTFQQKVTPDISTEAETLLPYYINYLGGNWTESTQCTGAGQNSFQNNQACLNNDLNNLWAVNNTPTSWAHFRRQDLPVHFSIAESWTVADMYQEGVIAATEPNRVTWMTGSVNCPGGPQTPDQGGAVLDNNGTPGCEAPGFACFPFSWKTVPEFHQDAGVTWQVYQDVDNFGDDALSSFVQYQNAGPDDPLTKYGNSYPGLDKFYSDAEAGILPQVSWIVGPAELSEHVPYLPRDGAWLQKKVIDAVVHGAAYNSTVVMISYDGFRVPFYIVSPWTRGGNVFTEMADHNSQIIFVEQWLEALGYNGVATDQMPAWRRQHMSTLLNAFDFDHPDYSIPNLVEAMTPSEDADGNWDAASICQGKYGEPPPKPPAPFGPENENSDPSKLSEEGFKSLRGYLTEGRYLVFEMNGYAVTAGVNASDITGTEATSDHRNKNQRWVSHATGGTAIDGGQGGGTFVLSSAADGRFLADHTSLAKDRSGAETYTIADMGNGKGYSLMKENGKYLSINLNGTIDIVGSGAKGFQILSVTYQS